MWGWVDRLGVLLVDAGFSAAALLAVVALAMVVSRQPARRLRLARAAVIGLLALVPLEASGLLPRLDPIAVPRGAGLGSHPLWSSGSVSGGLPAAAKAAIVSVASHAEGPAWLGGWLARGLVVAYAAGVIFGLARLTLGYLGLAWVAARRSVAPSPEARAVFAALPFSREGRRPRLAVAARVRRPVLVGFPRPLILIPPELDPAEPSAATRDQLRLALLHELAHAEAGDPWFALASHLAQCVGFVLPPLWWVVARMRLDQEFLADRRAALGFGPLREYAASLLEFASSRASARPLPLRSGAVDADLVLEGSPLVQRVLMLVRCPFPVESRPPLWWTWGLPVLALLATLGASSLSLGPPGTGPPAPTPPKAAAGQSFRVARLDVPPKNPGAYGRAPLFELPLRLPERFDLTIEVLADPPTLALMRVVGLPLRAPRAQDAAPPVPESWHVVSVRRDERGVTLRIDGRPSPADLDLSSLTSWLSVEPAPGRDSRFRSLNLTW